MKIIYGITKEVYSTDTNSRISYGIAAYACTDDGDIAYVAAAVHDITADRDSLERLAMLCNSLELSLIHLKDVLEDFLRS